MTEPELFEQLATQALKMAMDMPDPKSRQLMEEIAERYEAIAEWFRAGLMPRPPLR